MCNTCLSRVNDNLVTSCACLDDIHKAFCKILLLRHLTNCSNFIGH